MTSYVFPPPQTPSLPVVGSEARFPVRRIFCVGRNYADHAREMGHDPDREPPFFFDKPADALVIGEAAIPYPPLTAKLEHEAELVACLGAGGRDIPVDRALDLVWGYAIGNDLTRRDVQAQAKKLGRPWSLAKGFDASAVCGPVHPLSATGHPASGRIALSVNGATRQEGDLAQMIWSLAEVISILSREILLCPGDLIYTGTPAGVGPLQPGDRIRIEIAGLGHLENTVA
ncbi:fumarylacetoacetate hydrolase family protein [Pseudogemmobacter sonorensis]|uniref:fumarylacetoacetate hydrolase family protein n=1 Tax=Pseudogemmobacter sonorensis TaxID=2989681 RepID=UPI0036BD17A6